MNVKKLFQHIESNILGDELMATSANVDSNANGVQIFGADRVKKIAVGVSCNSEFLDKAVKWDADVCIFHHGLSFSERHVYNSRLDIPTQKQLKIIFDNDLTVAGYHYALDAHKSIGNNAQIIKLLGAKQIDIPYFDNWGWVAEFEKGIFVQDVAKKCSQIFKHDVFMVLSGEEKVKRIGVCSGGAKPSGKYLFDIERLGIDLHISGEISEGGPAKAKESGFNYFSCGHYATEVFGVKALAGKIKNKYPKIEVEFIDVWNEL